MIAGAFVLPDVIVGMIEASATRKPRMPCTRITLVARARRWFEECQRRSKNTPGAGIEGMIIGAAAGGVAGLGLGAKEYLDDQTNTVEHCLRSRG